MFGKIFHCVWLTLLFITSITTANSSPSKKNPLKLFLQKKIHSLDLDEDGRPDIVRQMKDNQVVSVVFSPTRSPGYKSITQFLPNQVTLTREYNLGALVKTKTLKETASSSVEVVESFFPERTKIVRTITQEKRKKDPTLNVSKYNWKNKRWTLTSFTQEPLQMQHQDSTSPGTTTGSSWSIPTPEPITEEILPPIGYNVSGHCNQYDQQIINKATNIIVDDILPCLRKANPFLTAQLMTNLATYNPTIRCHDSSCDGALACTRSEASSALRLERATPSVRRNTSAYSDDEDLARQTASTIFHEHLHNITPHRHSRSPDGRFDDSVYGCESLCEPGAGTARLGDAVDHETSCQRCVREGVPSFMVASRTSLANEVCDQNRSDQALADMQGAEGSGFQDRCLIQGGQPRTGSACFCATTQTQFDPFQESCRQTSSN